MGGKMIATRKYAVKFPGLDTFRSRDNVSIFSESGIIKTENTFFSAIDVASSLAEFVVQKNNTKELGKQLAYKKQALDAEIDNKIEQMQIQYEEEAKRLKIQLKSEKEAMTNEFHRMKVELATKSNEIDFAFEEYIKSNAIFFGIINREKAMIESIHPFIETLAEDYANRREYIKYCEIERRSLDLIDNYIKAMI